MASSSLESTREDEDQVQVDDQKLFVKILTLNRPKQLNALSFNMVSRLLELFLAYETDPKVNLVILKGKGRAFSSGADISALAHDVIRGCWKISALFFWNEFILNYVMATYSKTQVSILNGIVMGGGAGASIHGRFRVATENSVFAMPETGLGLFPDVGASYFLSSLPGFFGEYVGLTGARLDAAEMLSCGLATHFVPSQRLCSLEEALIEKVDDSSDPAFISSIIDKFSDRPSLKEQSSYHRSDVIDKCFSLRTVEEIIAALENEASKRLDSWISRTILLLKKASPLSLKITLRSIREGRVQSLCQCLVREYRMLSHVLKAEVCKDGIEGCRAMLWDKDKNPKWEPSELGLVSEEMVERHFCKVNDEEWEDLRLPKRSNLHPFAMAKLD